MTAREKLAIEHPEDCGPEFKGGCYSCPHLYGYLEKDSSICSNLSMDTNDRCSKCWNREIPGTEEKETKNMSDNLIEKAYDEKYGSTSASSHMYDVPERTDATKYETCDLDYKAEYESLKVENEKLKMGYETLTRDINRATERLNVYRHVIKTVEAMTGRDILEGF